MNEFHQTALKAQAALERRSMGNLIIDLCIVGLKVREQTNEDRLDEFKRLIRQTGQIA